MLSLINKGPKTAVAKNGHNIRLLVCERLLGYRILEVLLSVLPVVFVFGLSVRLLEWYLLADDELIVRNWLLFITEWGVAGALTALIGGWLSLLLVKLSPFCAATLVVFLWFVFLPLGNAVSEEWALISIKSRAIEAGRAGYDKENAELYGDDYTLYGNFPGTGGLADFSWKDCEAYAVGGLALSIVWLPMLILSRKLIRRMIQIKLKQRIRDWGASIFPKQVITFWSMAAALTIIHLAVSGILISSWLISAAPETRHVASSPNPFHEIFQYWNAGYELAWNISKKCVIPPYPPRGSIDCPEENGRRVFELRRVNDVKMEIKITLFLGWANFSSISVASVFAICRKKYLSIARRASIYRSG